MRLIRILPAAAIAVFCATLVYAQIGRGAISGRVLDRDGKPLQGAVVIGMSRDARDRNIVIARTESKTNRNGSYSLSGLYQGRYEVILMVDGATVMAKGQAIGDDIFINDQTDMTINFDMRKAPAPGAATAPLPLPAATAAAGANDRTRSADTEVKTLFDAGRAALQAGGAATSAEEKLKNYDEAIAKFKLTVEKDPKQHAAFANLAKALSDAAMLGASTRPAVMPADEVAKRYADSAAAYRKAIENKPDEPAYIFNLSLVLGDAGKIEDAAKAAEEAAALNRASGSQAFFNLGASYIEKAKTAEAIQAFKRAIELDPNNAKAHYQLGVAYFGAADTIPLAVPYLETFLKLQPTSPDAAAAKALIDAAKANNRPAPR